MTNRPFYQNKTVMVTGGAGFIGSHLCEELLDSGAKVIAVDNFLTGSQENIQHLQKQFPDRFSLIVADVSMPVSEYLPAEVQLDAVFHFASPASPPYYQAHPVETYLVNSLGTHQLLQHLLAYSPRTRFLFASTSEVYGDPQEHPQKESYWGNVNPNGPRSCYDEAKRLGEAICGVHARDFKMDVRIVRIFNTYGPRMDLDDGRVIPDFIKQSLHRQPFTIHGDGSQTRSYCYVSDLVNGVLTFAEKDELSGETFNLGNPDEYTIMETAQSVVKATTSILNREENKVDASPQMQFKELPQDDPLRRKPDISKAMQLLNWQPQVSFEEGLKKTIVFFHNQQKSSLT